ncbi:DnaJ domain-containing protein [Aspergillus crustosus]
MASSYTRQALDCYEILEISQDATLKDINTAYKKLALKYHPDKAEGVKNAIRFRKIQEAVEVLRDPTRRKEHDEQFGRSHKSYSEEELLFTNPQYTGWRPKDMYKRFTNPRDRYAFSYSESVHMNPKSKESEEELARCQRAREEEAQLQEELRACELFAEDLAKEAERLQSKKQQAAHRWFDLWNPGAGAFHPSEPFHAGFAAGVDTGTTADDLAGDGEGGLNGATEASSGYEIEMESETGMTGHNSTIDPDDISMPNVKVDTKSEAEPVVETEPRPEYDAELDISNIASAGDTVPDDTDADVTIPDTENGSGGYSEFDEKSSAGNNQALEEHASVYTISPGRATEYVTASPGSPPILNSAHYTTNGVSFSIGEEAQNDPSACSGENALDENASVYYDFSDTQPAESEDDSDHDEHSPTEDSHPSSNDNPPTTAIHDADPNGAELYPYLAPFVPFFTDKLAHSDGRYTTKNVQTELKGMVMETYCGWLETLRSTIPDVGPSSVLDVGECRHLGYWKKELGLEKCVVCDLWRPIYTLVCPGCGIKRCVGCKFEGGTE